MQRKVYRINKVVAGQHEQPLHYRRIGELHDENHKYAYNDWVHNANLGREGNGGYSEQKTATS